MKTSISRPTTHRQQAAALSLFVGAVLALSACDSSNISPPAKQTPAEMTPTPDSPSASADRAAQKSVGPISAEPNPVPAGDGPGKTTITWDTGDGSVAEVYLSVDGGEEKVFGKHSKNSQEAPWISAGPVYEFRLYQGTERTQLLGSVKVTRNRK